MPAPNGSSATSLVAVPGNPQIEALVDFGSPGPEFGAKWGGALGSGVNVSFSFPNLGSVWSRDNVTGYGPGGYPFGTTPEPRGPQYDGLDAAQQNAVRISLANWSHVANISFSEVADNASVVGDIRVAVTGGGFMDPFTYAYTYTPENAAYAGDVWLNAVQPVASGDDYSLGANGYATVLHELGHAIGLNHPFSHDGTVGAFPAQFESLKYSIMSYSDRPGHQDSGASSYYPTTPMLMDIQALQYLYGPNTAWAAGDDLYTFDQGGDYYQAIWDSGGDDTIQYNAATDGALIDLNAGHFSQLGRPLVLSDLTPQDDDVAIAFNVSIENAIGGGGSDVLIGNGTGNALSGGAGNDVLQGGAGNDSLHGNQGADTLSGDAGNDALFGDNGNDALSGDSGNDTLLGDNGNDSIAGGLGDDNINGNNGFDTIDGGDGNDLIHGGLQGDIITGGDGNDQLFGDLGDDTVAGGAGNDTIAGGAGNDVFRYDATSLNTGDVTANGIDVINGAVAGELISMLGLTDDLAIAGTALNALSSDAVVGGAIDASNSVAFAGGVLEIDVNGDGAFNAADDFQVTLTGVTSVTYNATDDLFHLA